MRDEEKLSMWLEARGLDPELAARMGWECKSKNGGAPWLRIPYFHDGKLVTEQFRNLDQKKFRFKAGGEVDLWNIDAAYDTSLNDQPLVIAEGACDGLAIIQSGFVRTIALPGWSKNNVDAEDYAPFKRHEEAIKAAGKIVVFQHNDEAGSALLRGVANFFDEQDVCYVDMTGRPEGYDANDVLRDHGPAEVERLITHAKRIDPPGGIISGFSDLPPLVPRQVWKMDYPSFDGVVAFRSRAMSVMTGIPGSGKTTMLVFMMHHLVRVHGMRIGLMLFETDAAEVKYQLLRLHGINDLSTDEQREAVIAKLDKHYRIVTRLEDTDEVIGMSWLKRMMRQLVREGCKVIAVDPFNELEHQLMPGEQMTNYLNVALQKVRQWCDRYDAHMIILAHPKKVPPGHTPTGYDIADSAAWYNKADMGLTVQQKMNKTWGKHTELVCWKVRNRQTTGTKPGVIKLEFDEIAMVYRPAQKITRRDDDDAQTGVADH